VKFSAFFFALFWTIAISLAASLPAQAQQRSRVYVSVNGVDGNPCTALSPCRTFQFAHDNVAAGGEISVLDEGGFGMVTITKAISIVSIGFEAGIATPVGGAAIIVNAGSGDKVLLRGLTLDGAGMGAYGVDFNSGASLEIVDCIVRNYQNTGIILAPNASSNILLLNTKTLDNNYYGVTVTPRGNGVVNVVFHHVEMDGNGTGLSVDSEFGDATSNVTISDSVVSQNYSDGIDCKSGAAPAAIMVRNSLISYNNNFGLTAIGSAARIWLGGSTVGSNGVSVETSGSATINSYGNNNIVGNGNNVLPPQISLN